MVKVRSKQALNDLKHAARVSFTLERNSARNEALRIITHIESGRRYEHLTSGFLKHLKGAVRVRRVLVDLGENPDTPDKTIDLMKYALLLHTLKSPNLGDDDVDYFVDVLSELCASADQANDLRASYYERVRDIFSEGGLVTRNELKELLETATRLLDKAGAVLHQDAQAFRRGGTYGASNLAAEVNAMVGRARTMEHEFDERLAAPVVGMNVPGFDGGQGQASGSGQQWGEN